MLVAGGVTAAACSSEPENASDAAGEGLEVISSSETLMIDEALPGTELAGEYSGVAQGQAPIPDQRVRPNSTTRTQSGSNPADMPAPSSKRSKLIKADPVR